MTKQERIMLRKGWVSAALAAQRLGVHVVTVHRLVASGRIPARATQIVGNKRYVQCSALAESQPPEVAKTFGLLDWSDALRQADAEDRLERYGVASQSAQEQPASDVQNVHASNTGGGGGADDGGVFRGDHDPDG